MVFQNDILAGASGTAAGYTIDQSIRFNDDDTAYLTRTQDTGDSKRIATFSWWMKRGSNFGTESAVIAAAASSRFLVRFNTSDQLTLRLTNGTTEYTLTTNMVFRDPSAWYHCVWRIDVTQATAADRSQLYVNGSAVTFTGSSLPAQNTDVVGLADATTQRIGILSHTTAASKYDGYLAEFYYIDGQALDPTDFGEFNDDGVWVSKAYAGSYGTNGFYLKGQDSADLGNDSSGNGNNFTSSGLTADDQRADTPTNNMMTFNPLNNMRDDGDPTDGNRVFYNTGGTRNIGGTTFHFTTGKYVQAFSFDGTGTSNWQIGSQPSDRTAVNKAPGSNEDLGEAPLISPFTTYYVGVGLVGTNNTGITADTADTIWVAMDLDSGKQWIGLYDDSAASMIWFDSSAGQTGDPAAGSNPVYTGTANRSYNFALCSRDSTKITLLEESEATGTVPTGFTYVGAVQDTYATPAIADGSAYFQVSLYTGNGTAIGSGGKSVTQDKNSTFQPDFVWIKKRNGAADHALYDAVRGTTKDLASNDSNAETTETEGLTAFDAAGFTVGSLAKVNTSSDTYVAWQWLAANDTTSNSDGSITSTVSANTTSGFSIVTYTGDGNDNATVGHGLGVTPKTVWLLPRSNGDNKQVSNWETGVTAFTEDLKLNVAEAANSSSSRVKGGSSTTFTLGTDPNVNGSGNTYLAYCFNEIEGFSKFGTYTGNGSSNGVFAYCGFRPALVILRRTNAAENWVMVDSARNEYNAANLRIYADTTNADITSTTHDFLSNGFKLRASDGGVNASGNPYVFMAFAENPFGGNGVAPATAR